MNLKPLKNIALSEQAKLQIKKYIHALDLSKGNKLPSEDLLAQTLGVSRITIRSALNELATEGVIFRRHGKGTFVNPEAMQMKVQLSPVLDFKTMIRNSGYEPDVKVLGHELAEADATLALQLRIAPGSPIVIAKKIFFADQHPCAYCVDYLPQANITQESDLNRLYEYEDSIFLFLHDLAGKSAVWDRVELVATSCANNPELESVFGCNAKALLLLKGVNFSDCDEALLYAEEYIDTDFIRFNLIRQKLIDYA